MIRTVVCEKEGCSGNTFLIETQGNNLVLTCEHCKSKYEFDISYYDFIILSNCSKKLSVTPSLPIWVEGFKVFAIDLKYALCLPFNIVSPHLY